MKLLTKNPRALFYSALLVILFAVLTYISNTSANPPWPIWFSHALYFIELPALLFGTIISGNVHQPNPFAAYAALLFTYFVLIYGMYLLVAIIKKRANEKLSKPGRLGE